MKKIKLILILILSINISVLSQTDNLIPEAKKIKKAYEDFMSNPESKDLQLEYIKIFPENAELFKKVFHPEKFDQLYKYSHDYIINFTELSADYPILVGEKLITLCIGLKKWDADATGHIQHSTMEYANLNYTSFIRLIKELSNQDLETLITFLADVENHSAYTEYKKLMEKLKSNNETELFELFKSTKETRMSQKDYGF